MDITVKFYYDAMVNAYKQFKRATIRERSQKGLYNRYIIAKQNYYSVKGM